MIALSPVVIGLSSEEAWQSSMIKLAERMTWWIWYLAGFATMPALLIIGTIVGRRLR